MYVLIWNNFVIDGPRPWNMRSFKNTLRDDCGIEFDLPAYKTDNLPIIISDTIKILPAVLNRSVEHNPKIHHLDGPFWEFTNDLAIGSYIAKDNSIFGVKEHLKGIVTANRYTKEVSGFTHNIGNRQITIDTDRVVRNMFFQKYLLMADGESVEWKFPEGWITLSKSDLGSIVSSAATHIQNQFDWESSKLSEIESATTLSELDAIALE